MAARKVLIRVVVANSTGPEAHQSAIPAIREKREMVCGMVSVGAGFEVVEWRIPARKEVGTTRGRILQKFASKLGRVSPALSWGV